MTYYERKQRELKNGLEELEPGKPAETSGWLGATVAGVFQIQVIREPAKVYVRKADLSFVKAYNDPGYYVADPNDPANQQIAVMLFQDDKKEWHVKRSENEIDAQLQSNPTLLLPPHTHVPGDIGDDETNAGNIMVSDGTSFVSAPLDGTGIIVKTGDTTFVVAGIGQNSSDPTITDDSASGYLAGYSWWLNTSSGQYFDLTDDSVGAAVWVPRGAGGGGNFTDLADAPAAYTGAAGKLVAVNGTEDGLEFVDASAVGGGVELLTATVLYESTLVSDGSFDTGTLPTGYDSYEIEAWVRSTAAVTADNVNIYFNGDFTTNYRALYVGAANGSAVSGQLDSPFFGAAIGASGTAGYFSHIRGHIFKPEGGQFKIANSVASERRDATILDLYDATVHWDSSAPITSIQLRTDNDPTDTFTVDSWFRVIGYKEEAIGGGAAGSNTGDFASAPAAPAEGLLYLPNDVPYLMRFNGAEYDHFWNGIPVVPPPPAGWSWDNQDGASVDALHYISAPASSGLRIRYRTAPTPPYVITGLLAVNAIGVPNIGYGMCFRESGSGKLSLFLIQNDGAGIYDLCVQKFTNSVTFSANYLVVSGNNALRPWFRIADDGANRICSIFDGYHAIEFHSVGNTDFLTADQVGFFVNPFSATYPAGVQLLSWKEE